LKQEIIYPKKKRGTFTEPLKLTEPHYLFCGPLGFRGTHVGECWARLYFSTHMEIHFDEHKSNYTFIGFTRKCFLNPTMRFYSRVQSLRALTKAWALHSHTFAYSHPPYSY